MPVFSTSKFSSLSLSYFKHSWILQIFTFSFSHSPRISSFNSGIFQIFKKFFLEIVQIYHISCIKISSLLSRIVSLNNSWFFETTLIFHSHPCVYVRVHRIIRNINVNCITLSLRNGNYITSFVHIVLYMITHHDIHQKFAGEKKSVWSTLGIYDISYRIHIEILLSV